MVADFSVRYRKSNLHHTHCHSERSARGAKPRAEGEETAPPRLEDCAFITLRPRLTKLSLRFSIFLLMRWPSYVRQHFYGGCAAFRCASSNELCSIDIFLTR